ncbi:MAG: DEAD/DEAH box helicase [Candidatus Levybacteria bacterium]|nr:DEAD/DEAH box helicase [Candidatus Levybacteria bacterium]
MFKSNARSSYGKRSTGSSYASSQGNGSRGRFSYAGKKKQAKKLEEHLFVKSAAFIEEEDQVLSKARFSDFNLIEKLQRNITDHGYTIPTPIQEKTIPFILDGRDVIGIANTGTGKTAAFLIPLINKVALDRNERVIIVTPTRELAKQIADELHKFTRGLDMEMVLCIGGSDINRQYKKLHHNPHFVIGTPGRLKDLIERNRLKLFQFRNIVLDEVDKMVDIGFINDINYFISLLPEQRHSLFFSATVTDKVRGILKNFVNNPETVSIKRQDTSENIEQDIVRVTNGNKVDTLHDLLTSDGFDKVLIFGRTKWGIEKLMKSLLDRGFKAASIHGNKSQGQRQRALDQFKQDQVRILLATDVASRGLDIENVTHVINFDAPESYDDYIHRIGRTGRAGKKGTALTFVE